MADLATIIGYVASTATISAFLPQVIKILKTKETKDLSLLMWIVFNIGGTLWLIYGIMIESFPVILTNVLLLFFGLTILVLKVKYK
jgi:MtN3 and saliva related transmembrane protein|tara:strand:- start:974 stop:1231 length:258 start_codon:yes stop_codon:yes gene_type:complete